jgi:precorrin-8X/cobalt-precorrin-8 methylmutase
VADVGMVRQGIRTRDLPRPASVCVCLLDEPETAALAAREGITRSAAAMRRSGRYLDGAVAAIGNAPTALFELLSMIRAGRPRPP